MAGGSVRTASQPEAASQTTRQKRGQERGPRGLLVFGSRAAISLLAALTRLAVYYVSVSGAVKEANGRGLSGH